MPTPKLLCPPLPAHFLTWEVGPMKVDWWRRVSLGKLGAIFKCPLHMFFFLSAPCGVCHKHAPSVVIYLGNWMVIMYSILTSLVDIILAPHSIYSSTWMSTVEHFCLDTILGTGDLYGLPGSVFLHSYGYEICFIFSYGMILGVCLIVCCLNIWFNWLWFVFFFDLRIWSMFLPWLPPPIVSSAASSMRTFFVYLYQ